MPIARRLKVDTEARSAVIKRVGSAIMNSSRPVPARRIPAAPKITRSGIIAPNPMQMGSVDLIQVNQFLRATQTPYPVSIPYRADVLASMFAYAEFRTRRDIGIFSGVHTAGSPLTLTMTGPTGLGCETPLLGVVVEISVSDSNALAPISFTLASYMDDYKSMSVETGDDKFSEVFEFELTAANVKGKAVILFADYIANKWKPSLGLLRKVNSVTSDATSPTYKEALSTTLVVSSAPENSSITLRAIQPHDQIASDILEAAYERADWK
jgi:hypothetical protein